MRKKVFVFLLIVAIFAIAMVGFFNTVTNKKADILNKPKAMPAIRVAPAIPVK